VKIKVLKQTDNELKIEIEGAGHGVCNLLQKKLLENKTIDQAGYDVPHPLASLVPANVNIAYATLRRK